MTRGLKSCEDILAYIQGVSGNVWDKDARIFTSDFEAIIQPYMDFMTKSAKKEDLYKAIHVDKSYKKPIFEQMSDAVAKGYASDNLIDYSSWYNSMIAAKHPFIVMAGEFDIRDGPVGQVPWMNELLQLSKTFWSQDRQLFKYPGGTGDDD